MKCRLSASVLLLACSAPLSAASVGAALERERLSERIVERWHGDVARTWGIDAAQWADAMRPVFRDASLDALRQAAAADSFAAMDRGLLGDDDGAASPGNALRDASKALGDASTDLVYTPLQPCRVFDTRLAGGPIAPAGTRAIVLTNVSSYSFQGGADIDCGLGSAGTVAAVAMHLTTVAPDGAGYVTAYQAGEKRPTAATLNYTAGAIVNGLAIVPLAQGALNRQMDVYSFAGTHLVGDVVGYFARPAATALECVTLDRAFDISSNASGGVSQVCPAGYTRTGGGCSSFGDAMRLRTSRSSGAAHRCFWENPTGAPGTGYATVDCCRVPGR